MSLAFWMWGGFALLVLVMLALEHAAVASLLMMDPSGQCPPNGRGEGHTVADALNLLALERMAAREQGWRAGQYRRAAMLAFANLARWRRQDAPALVF